MENLFEEYKKIRIRKKITLEQITKKTRISKEYLEKIERGDLEFLPYPYVKGFIKVYAKYIGINLQELEKKFDELGKVERKALEDDEIKKEAEKKGSKDEVVLLVIGRSLGAHRVNSLVTEAITTLNAGKKFSRNWGLPASA